MSPPNAKEPWRYLCISSTQRWMLHFVHCRYQITWIMFPLISLGYGYWMWETQVQIPTLPLTCCKSLGHLPLPSEPQITIPISEGLCENVIWEWICDNSASQAYNWTTSDNFRWFYRHVTAENRPIVLYDLLFSIANVWNLLFSISEKAFVGWNHTPSHQRCVSKVQHNTWPEANTPRKCMCVRVYIHKKYNKMTVAVAPICI